MATKPPHDAFFRYLFSLSEVADAFFRAFLPEEIQQVLDLDSLEPDETQFVSSASQFEILFYKGDEFLKTEEGTQFIERLLVYYSSLVTLNREDLRKQLQTTQLSTNMKSKAMSLYDQLILEGRIKGKAEAIVEFARKLCQQSPEMSDEKISLISGAPVEVVQKIRQEIQKGK